MEMTGDRDRDGVTEGRLRGRTWSRGTVHGHVRRGYFHEPALGLVEGPAHHPVRFLVRGGARRIREIRGRVARRLQDTFAGGVVDRDLRIEETPEIQGRRQEDQDDRQDQGKFDDRLPLGPRRASTHQASDRGRTQASVPRDRIHRLGPHSWCVCDDVTAASSSHLSPSLETVRGCIARTSAGGTRWSCRRRGERATRLRG